ncbi:transmembrane protein, putative [Medicago truncatula]|uniref:Transmembrane protein, putative n=1 Tax=Medicago truncatula TaxID=3880 RepID=G7JI73_MEDTR|nr:transmembrane protein, putative [Medicago truncatula]
MKIVKINMMQVYALGFWTCGCVSLIYVSSPFSNKRNDKGKLVVMPTRSPPIKSKEKGKEVVIYVSRTPTNMKDKRKETLLQFYAKGVCAPLEDSMVPNRAANWSQKRSPRIGSPVDVRLIPPYRSIALLVNVFLKVYILNSLSNRIAIRFHIGT